MLTRLIHFWEFLRNSYWLVPSIMLLTVIGVSYGLLAADARLDLNQYRGLGWLVFSTTEGARAVLSTIAASTFAAATLTFSVTMVTLSLTSSQFGPRLLRNFLRDTVNQFTFGAFIATFIYCLLIMRGLVANNGRIPNISVSLSILMVLFDAALFISFISHLTSSIRVEHITDSIGKELIDDIKRLLPDEFTNAYCSVSYDHPLFDLPPTVIRSIKFGYVQAINIEELKSLAESEEITIKLLCKPGHFIPPQAPIAEVWPPIDSESNIDKLICSSFLLGNEPSAEQDIEFTIRQLVQIAARALSPSINDPFTAMACIDYLGTGLAVIAGRDLPAAQIRNKQGRLLLIKNKLTFQNICDACFTIIRQMSNDNPPVVIYLLETLGRLAFIVKRQEDREAVLQVAKLTVNSAIGKCEMDYDRRAIQQRFEQLKNTIERHVNHVN
jgi:uncharacterized membrane protein